MESRLSDFLVIRKDVRLGYIVDVEPHSPDFADNGKAKGFAEYARQNRCRTHRLIRMDRDRLAISVLSAWTCQSAIRNKNSESDDE